METIRIRQARETDLAELNEIYNETVRNSVFAFDVHQKTAEERRTWFAAHVPPYAVFVAEVNGTVAAWASISPWAPHGAYAATGEHSLFVGARHRGAGVGKALLAVVIEEAERTGFHVLIGRITAGNAISHGSIGHSASRRSARCVKSDGSSAVGSTSASCNGSSRPTNLPALIWQAYNAGCLFRNGYADSSSRGALWSVTPPYSSRVSS
jgi:L-amino acid N-acyltransferase YncA